MMKVLIGAVVFAASVEAPAYAGESGRAVCDLGFEFAGDGDRAPEQVQATCAGEDGALQAAADASLQRVDMDFPGRVRFVQWELAETLVLTRSVDGPWTVAPGQILVRATPQFPARAVERGATHMLCALALSPGPDGGVPEPEIECLSDERSTQRIMERAMQEAASHWRLAPTDLEYCMNEQVYVGATVIVQGRRQHAAPMPDPAGLPNLCAMD